MPRTLIIALLLALVVGCAAPRPEPVVAQAAASPPVLKSWLDLQASVAARSTEEVAAELTTMAEPPVGVDGLYYWGLLNQQLPTFNGWVRARDTFRQLHNDKTLPVQKRQLAGILEQYNQERINWYQRYSDLYRKYGLAQEQLRNTEQENQLLQRKIQAITDLEATISTRKEE